MLSPVIAPETVRLALARGVAAFVSKADTAEKIIAVVQQTLGGGPASAFNANAAPDAGSRLGKSRLTPRQCEVLDLLCEGLSNKMIAKRMELSEFTVRGHVQAVLILLRVKSRSQVTFAARRAGLIG